MENKKGKFEDENEAALVSKLEEIFRIVNEWLKFAEQKNASLIVLNAGIIWGVSRIFSKMPDVEQSSICLNWLGYSLSSLSLLLGIVSLMPILTYVWYFDENTNRKDNALYFAHIAKYSDRAYLDLLAKKLELKQTTYTGISYDYASQLITNSKITMIKFSRFKVSSYLTLGAVLSFVVSIIIALTGNK